ncbi:methyltransferase [Streptomyces sp. enrichment culture]|uniref:methyltransferase n=1 Tax=Streptomyces sp. enrichment culture TaxID=1795815 RepID=UPI003F572B04
MSIADRKPESGQSSSPAGRETGQLLELAMGYLYSAALSSAARLGIADHLADGPRTVEELAAATRTDAGHLYRLLRYVATKGVFHEDETGRFHLTPLAQPLRSGVPGSLRDTVMVYTEAPFWEPTGRLHEAVSSGATVFEKQYGTPFYHYVATDPEFGAAFNSSMAAASQAMSNGITRAFDFSQAKTVVDVGGGRGGLLRSVLQHNPHMTGILFDRENVVAEHVLDTPDLAGRWKAEGGDFFVSVPSGADVYLLKHVLASWSDEECVRILRTCRDAMPAHGRLLVANPMIPAGNEPHFGKTIDILMMTVLNGMNRTRAQYEELLKEAGFKIVRFLEPSPQAAVLEGALAG